MRKAKERGDKPARMQLQERTHMETGKEKKERKTKIIPFALCCEAGGTTQKRKGMAQMPKEVEGGMSNRKDDWKKKRCGVNTILERERGLDREKRGRNESQKQRLMTGGPPERKKTCDGS